jgi:DNA-binding response OmpR family regulator
MQDVSLSNALARFRIFLTAVPSMETLAEISMTQIRFTRKEAKVLDVLEGSPGEVVTRKFLLDKVFGYNDGVKTRTLDVHVSRLRAKLADKVDVRISAVRGLGYILERCCIPTEPGPKQNSSAGTIRA